MLFQATLCAYGHAKYACWAALAAAVVLACSAAQPSKPDFADARKLYLTGRYEDCVKAAQAGVQQEPRNEDWPVLLSQTLLTLGRYAEAQSAVSNSLARNPWGIRVRLAARDVLLQNGRPDEAKAMLTEINDRASTRGWAYRDSANLVALGRTALYLGADARRVLDNFFNRVKKVDPDYRETYLAIGQLALDKGDFDLASKTYQEGLDRFADDVEMLYGLAKSYTTGDRGEMVTMLQKALSINERHVPSLLLLADHLIDGEEYKKAGALLDKVLAVNEGNPRAWAYRAVLAHLDNDGTGETSARERALSTWKTNPEVDHLIGLKLSQKYRFAEGSRYQRRALQADENYLPAKNQLAQDLMRLGEEEEGWALAEDVYKQDGYDVAAYNLVTLRDTLEKFQTLTNAEFRVRMAPREAQVYGRRVTNLLERAKRSLTKRYGVDLTNQTTVEIFPEQKDFAVRTFGMPGGEGFLGVCFGSVITANSPASQAAHSVNWESVLWHEFCHVITLGMTHNKMPRWLSEGISVFEERQANPAWGQGMNPRYREMILKGELTPVGNLSAAFLAPKTPFHLQFAYYESSLVVEFLIDHFGLNALKAILRDLGEGKTINQAIADHTADLARIEKDFAAFAKDRAQQLAPGLDWTEPQPDDMAKGEEAWISKHPKSFWGLTQRSKKLLSEKRWDEAKANAQQLLDLYPESTGADSAYWLLAKAYRGLNQPDQERATLNKLARIDADAVDAYSRLMELDSLAQDWTAVARDTQRFLAVNPLVALPYRYLATASDHLSKDGDSIDAYQTLLLLDPPDPADIHYRLARLLYRSGDPSAKRHVLQALEEAPRFRDAHKLLLIMAEAPSATSSHATAEALP